MPGTLPKAYLRLDPDLDAKHPDNLDEFIRLLCAAARQPWRGRFRSRATVEALIGRAGTRRAIERGDLVPAADHECRDCPPAGTITGTELYLAGWDIWQEGDLTVAERMRRYRSRHTPVTEGVTKPSLRPSRGPSPPSEAVDNKTVPTEPTPEPPNPHDADDLEVLADGLLGHPATPGQLRAVRTLDRKVGRDRTLEVMRTGLTSDADDRFGEVLDALGSEATNARKPPSRFAYMDAESA